MAEVLPAHAILSVMRELSEQAMDMPVESLCLALVNLLEDPALQEHEDLFGQLVLFGAGLWRHTATFKAGGPDTVQ
jgi:hypothetical protein